jgi:hypothetical protein
LGDDERGINLVAFTPSHDGRVGMIAGGEVDSKIYWGVIEIFFFLQFWPYSDIQFILSSLPNAVSLVP